MILCLNPACSAFNAPDAKFCIRCGMKLLIQSCYQPIKELGEGAFGKTFLAVNIDKPSQPECVIKQFSFTSAHPDLVQKAKELFYQEAQQLKRLGKHDQIPELYTYHEQENSLYLIQEFVDGENLREELNQDGAFNTAKVRQVLIDLLPVLEFIHSHEVIHRDIKPENIMRRRSDRKLVLIDFGAVKQATATSLQRTGTIIGSPAYQAPEQGMGKAIFSSDLYSLGVSCLQLLTNMQPFDLYDAHEGEFVWRNYLLYQKVPDSLGKVLDQMTQGVVRSRYKSAKEVWQALHPPAPKASVLVPPKSSASRSVNPFPKTPFIGKIIHKITGNSFIENLGSGVQLEMISIPGGTFQMGSHDYDREKPVHQVSIKPFYLGKYVVTQEQYRAVMGKNPARFKGAKLPVEMVSWHDAIEFCQKLSLKTGKNYRLPSEAQWEYACRAGTQTKHYFGDDPRHLGGCGWYNGNSHRKTHPVGLRSSNQFGLYDMQGNVWEWCADNWHDNYYLAPNDGTPWMNNDDRSRCVMRGGSWNDNTINCRSAFRNKFNADFSYNNIGFRLCI
jgi:formylglycine-generating enzyme required for sulfatase activity/predicted Ser/Thr protein kinase